MAEKHIGYILSGKADCLSFPSGTVILLEEFPEDGKLKKFSGYFCKENIVYFQVWRKGNDEELDFHKVYEKEVDSELIGLGNQMVDIEEEVKVMKGDRLGIAVPEGALMIGYTKSNPIKYICKDYNSDIFSRKMMPYNFMAVATYV